MEWAVVRPRTNTRQSLARRHVMQHFKNRALLHVEQLEDRTQPSFFGMFSSAAVQAAIQAAINHAGAVVAAREQFQHDGARWQADEAALKADYAQLLKDL